MTYFIMWIFENLVTFQNSRKKSSKKCFNVSVCDNIIIFCWSLYYHCVCETGLSLSLWDILIITIFVRRYFHYLGDTILLSSLWDCIIIILWDCIIDWLSCPRVYRMPVLFVPPEICLPLSSSTRDKDLSLGFWLW